MTMPAPAPQSPRPLRHAGGLHYGWIIVGILVVVQVIGSAISQSAGVMVAPLRDPHGDFGWGIGTIGALLAVYYVVGALFAPVSGWLGERYGARRLMLAGGLLYGSSMLLLGLVRQPWHFLLAFSVLLALTQSICLVPLIAAVSGWFRRRLGLATGILWAAGGLGAALLAPLVGYLMQALGWQGTFWSLGAIGGGLILSLTVFFRDRPADLGLTPYGAAADDPPPAVRRPALERLRLQVFTRHMRRTRAFWDLPLIHGLGCAGHGIVLIYVVPFAVEQGLTLVAASVILSLIAVWSIGSRLLTPIVAERWGGKPIMAAALVIQGLTVPVLWWAHDGWTFYLFGSLFGLGFGGEMSAYLVVNRQYFGTGPTSTLYGWEMMGAMLGHAVATGLAGWVLARTGSFPLVLALSMAFSLVGVLVILHLESSARVLIPHWEESLPPEARLPWSHGAPPSIPTVSPSDLEAARAVDTPRHPTPRTAS
jgi:MFS family permease